MWGFIFIIYLTNVKIWLLFKVIQTDLRTKGDKMICPACNTKNDPEEEYCLNCGQKLIENNTPEEIP